MLVLRYFKLIAVVAVVVHVMTSSAFAQMPASMNGSGGCGSNGSAITYSAALERLPAGQVYVRANSPGLKTDASLYTENIATGKCQKLGAAQINASSWTRIGRVLASEGTSLVISSSYIGADAYASVATALIVPEGRCALAKQACIGQYHGHEGAIEPQTISVPGELLTVQSIPDISQEQIKYVEYYDGGDFLYATSAITPVDRQYLRGGDRTVKTVAYLTNNHIFTKTESVAMPSDPLYSRYISSTFYRLGSQTKFVVGILATAGLGALGFLTVRRIHAWRTYRTGHGIDAYLRSRH